MYKRHLFIFIAFIYSSHIYSSHVLANLPPKRNQTYIPAKHGNRWDAPPLQIGRLTLPGGRIETIGGSVYPYYDTRGLPSKSTPLSPIHEHMNMRVQF